jgi:hypothetical protein
MKTYYISITFFMLLFGCKTTDRSKVKDLGSCSSTTIDIKETKVALISYGGVNYFTPKLKATDVQVVLRVDQNTATEEYSQFGEILLTIDATDESKKQIELLAQSGIGFKNALAVGNAVLTHYSRGKPYQAAMSGQEAIVRLNEHDIQIEYALAERSALILAGASYELPCGNIQLGQIEPPEAKKKGTRGTFLHVSYYSADTEKQVYDVIEQNIGKSLDDKKVVQQKILEIYGKDLTKSDQLVLNKLDLTVDQGISKIIGSGKGLSMWAHSPVSHIGDNLLDVYIGNAPDRMKDELSKLRKEGLNNKVKSKILADRSTLRGKYELRTHIDL